jgi:hypothetical protein
MTSNLTNVLEAASHEKNFDKKKIDYFCFKSRCSYAERMESHGQKRLDNKRGG